MLPEIIARCFQFNFNCKRAKRVLPEIIARLQVFIFKCSVEFTVKKGTYTRSKNQCIISISGLQLKRQKYYFRT